MLIAPGIDEDGIREVLDFEVRPAEGAKAWEELIARLKERGVEEVIKRHFLRADFQVRVLFLCLPFYLFYLYRWKAQKFLL